MANVRGGLRLNLRLNPHLMRVAGGLVALALVLAACAGVGGTATPSASSAVPSTPFASAQAGGPTPIDSGPPIPVLGTENFYADLLTQIGGARVSATSLLNDPNADPHAFEASPSAAAAVADAQLVIVNGLGYDDFMQHLLGASPNGSRVVINVQQLLGLGSDTNAHIWYDPGTMPAVAAAAATALAKLEPANATYFAAREQAYLASLAPLNAKIAELKAKFSGAPVAFTEPVAGDLAKAIGLQVLTPESFQRAIENGTDPAPADVAAERDLLTAKTVRVLLFNSQVITPLTQQVHDLAVANGIPVVGVAETLPPQYRTYQEWQLAQMNELEAALAKGS
jgi:zinc/manganese transport system substrate-binding protein